MRRTDREVTDSEKIRDVITACHCCRLGFSDQGQVYIVPLNFGYEEADGRRIFYFHGAPEGRKIQLIRAGNPVGFELDTDYQLKEAPEACGYSARFRSVIGTGRVSLLEEPEEKIHALRCIMGHYTGRKDWEFPAVAVEKTAAFRLVVEELSCKEHD